jgi:type II secretory pathway pseudopilin PulG
MLTPPDSYQQKVSCSEDEMPKFDNLYSAPVPNACDTFSPNDHFNTSHHMNFPSRCSPEFCTNSQSRNNSFGGLHNTNHEPSFSHA